MENKSILSTQLFHLRLHTGSEGVSPSHRRLMWGSATQLKRKPQAYDYWLRRNEKRFLRLNERAVHRELQQTGLPVN